MFDCLCRNTSKYSETIVSLFIVTITIRYGSRFKSLEKVFYCIHVSQKYYHLYKL